MKGNEYLFEENKHLISKLAKKFFSFGKLGIEYEDLYQEASLALHLATVNFEPERWEGKPFEKFAVTYMYQTMMVFLLKQNIFYTPRDIVTLAAKIKREKLLEMPVAAIAKKVGETEGQIKKALQHLKGVHLVGIDAEIFAGEKALKYADILPDTNIVCVTEQASIQMFQETLNGKESVVFKLMLLDKTKQCIGDTVGLTCSNASHMAKRISQKYKKFTEVI